MCLGIDFDITVNGILALNALCAVCRSVVLQVFGFAVEFLGCHTTIAMIVF